MGRGVWGFGCVQGSGCVVQTERSSRFGACARVWVCFRGKGLEFCPGVQWRNLSVTIADSWPDSFYVRGFRNPSKSAFKNAWVRGLTREGPGVRGGPLQESGSGCATSRAHSLLAPPARASSFPVCPSCPLPITYSAVPLLVNKISPTLLGAKILLRRAFARGDATMLRRSRRNSSCPSRGPPEVTF